MLAILMCVLASLRPSILFQTKSKQPSTVAFLSDVSKSMTLQDAAAGQLACRPCWGSPSITGMLPTPMPALRAG